MNRSSNQDEENSPFEPYPGNNASDSTVWRSARGGIQAFGLQLSLCDHATHQCRSSKGEGRRQAVQALGRPRPLSAHSTDRVKALAPEVPCRWQAKVDGTGKVPRCRSGSGRLGGGGRGQQKSVPPRLSGCKGCVRCVSHGTAASSKKPTQLSLAAGLFQLGQATHVLSYQVAGSRRSARRRVMRRWSARASETSGGTTCATPGPAGMCRAARLCTSCRRWEAGRVMAQIRHRARKDKKKAPRSCDLSA
jgi:hypothetical protein